MILEHHNRIHCRQVESRLGINKQSLLAYCLLIFSLWSWMWQKILIMIPSYFITSIFLSENTRVLIILLLGWIEPIFTLIFDSFIDFFGEQDSTQAIRWAIRHKRLPILLKGSSIKVSNSNPNKAYNYTRKKSLFNLSP